MNRLSTRIAGLGLAALLWGILPTAKVYGEEVASIAPAVVSATPGPTVDTGDTSWLLISSALVLMMTIPGLSLFYGGLVRRKNVLSVLMQCFMITCLISIQWMLWGYSLSFGPDIKGFIGNLNWFGLKGVGLDPYPDYAATVPHQAFMIFQAMFAIITPALIIGAFAERMKFMPFVVFTLLWATLVYDPVCHWVWGIGGFIRKMGALDFAGGTVVHINAGIAALASALVLGRRVGYPHKMSPPHNLALLRHGRGPVVGGLVRFQRGQRPERERPCDQRVRGDPHGHRDGGTDLGRHGSDLQQASDRARHSSPARWRAWSPSHRPPASSIPWARWASAPARECSATSPSRS